MEHFISLGSQSIGFRDEANALKGKAAIFSAVPIFTL
jgi:hypothetical protein